MSDNAQWVQLLLWNVKFHVHLSIVLQHLGDWVPPDPLPELWHWTLLELHPPDFLCAPSFQTLVTPLPSGDGSNLPTTAYLCDLWSRFSVIRPPVTKHSSGSLNGWLLVAVVAAMWLSAAVTALFLFRDWWQMRFAAEIFLIMSHWCTGTLDAITLGKVLLHLHMHVLEWFCWQWRCTISTSLTAMASACTMPSGTGPNSPGCHRTRSA